MTEGRELDTRPQHVAEFEGSYIRDFEGKMPAQVLAMPAGFPRGCHLLFHVEARIRNVHYDEAKGKGREGDLVRVHQFAIENVHLAEVFDPNTRPDNVGGSSSGSAWVEPLLNYLEGRTEQLDLEEAEIPERLRELLENGIQTPVDDAAGF